MEHELSLKDDTPKDLEKVKKELEEALRIKNVLTTAKFYLSESETKIVKIQRIIDRNGRKNHKRYGLQTYDKMDKLDLLYQLKRIKVLYKKITIKITTVFNKLITIPPTDLDENTTKLKVLCYRLVGKLYSEMLVIDEKIFSLLDKKNILTRYDSVFTTRYSDSYIVNKPHLKVSESVNDCLNVIGMVDENNEQETHPDCFNINKMFRDNEPTLEQLVTSEYNMMVNSPVDIADSRSMSDISDIKKNATDDPESDAAMLMEKDSDPSPSELIKTLDNDENSLFNIIPNKRMDDDNKEVNDDNSI